MNKTKTPKSREFIVTDGAWFWDAPLHGLLLTEEAERTTDRKVLVMARELLDVDEYKEFQRQVESKYR